MDMDKIYLVILGITVISYLLGLFLSHFERKGDVSVASNLGNSGFINIFGVGPLISQPRQVQQSQEPQQQVSLLDDEII